jgi:hypothetical protein
MPVCNTSERIFSVVSKEAAKALGMIEFLPDNNQ